METLPFLQLQQNLMKYEKTNAKTNTKPTENVLKDLIVIGSKLIRKISEIKVPQNLFETKIECLKYTMKLIKILIRIEPEYTKKLKNS